MNWLRDPKMLLDKCFTNFLSINRRNFISAKYFFHFRLRAGFLHALRALILLSFVCFSCEIERWPARAGFDVGDLHAGRCVRLRRDCLSARPEKTRNSSCSTIASHTRIPLTVLSSLVQRFFSQRRLADKWQSRRNAREINSDCCTRLVI